MSGVRDTVARILAAEGAAVEALEPDGLEVLAPPRLQRALSVPESVRLGFGAALPEQAVRVSLESDWMEKLATLMQARGAFARLVIRAAGKLPDAAPLREKHLAFQNATYRLKSTETAHTRYLAAVFHVTAVSDEKREDLVPVCLNQSNGACADALAQAVLAGDAAARGAESSVPEDWVLPEPWSESRLRDGCTPLVRRRIREGLTPFLAGMERRMSKDLERVHAYHCDLWQETVAGKERRRKKAPTAPTDGDWQAKRTEAIAREYHAKVADVKRKYAMTLEVKLTQALEVIMPVQRTTCLLLRRKGSRPFHLDWNGLSKRLDVLVCEGCGALPKTQVVCDDRLHILCPECLAACAACGKPYCRACHPQQCPSCARAGHPPGLCHPSA